MITVFLIKYLQCFQNQIKAILIFKEKNCVGEYLLLLEIKVGGFLQT